MTIDYSIESSFERIQNVHTREYFQEVYQTFVNGNYRSSTVMLYSVLICDLVYKMRDLRDLYGDSKAKKILDEIESMQSRNPNSSEWESKLIEFIKDRTTLLEASDIVAIESLQKFRHLSAHPVLNNADLLFSPNRDTVKALMINILQGVLTNPPFFSNKIFDIMLEDLAEVKERITEFSKLQKYVKSRYLDRLKDSDFTKVFRSLWKVVFIADDLNSILNNNVNYSVLKIFILHNKQSCVQFLTSEPRYYSNINKDENVSKLMRLLANFPEFYSLLESSLRLLIESKISSDDEFRFISWYKSVSLKSHILDLKPDEFESIPFAAFRFINSLCEQEGCKDELLNFAIDYFGHSNSFDSTQNRYENIIDQIIKDLNVTQTKRLLEVSDNNNQIYRRIGMKNKLKIIADKYGDQIDKTLFARIYTDL